VACSGDRGLRGIVIGRELWALERRDRRLRRGRRSRAGSGRPVKLPKPAPEQGRDDHGEYDGNPEREPQGPVRRTHVGVTVAVKGQPRNRELGVPVGARR